MKRSPPRYMWLNARIKVPLSSFAKSNIKRYRKMLDGQVWDLYDMTFNIWAADSIISDNGLLSNKPRTEVALKLNKLFDKITVNA